MIKILKASAGSGKTFSLAKEYISLLLGSGRIGLLLGVVGIARATSEDAAREGESAYDSENLLHHGEASPFINSESSESCGSR